jgi:hypothetical protein
VGRAAGIEVIRRRMRNEWPITTEARHLRDRVEARLHELAQDCADFGRTEVAVSPTVAIAYGVWTGKRLVIATNTKRPRVSRMRRLARSHVTVAERDGEGTRMRAGSVGHPFDHTCAWCLSLRDAEIRARILELRKQRGSAGIPEIDFIIERRLREKLEFMPMSQWDTVTAYAIVEDDGHDPIAAMGLRAITIEPERVTTARAAKGRSA